MNVGISGWNLMCFSQHAIVCFIILMAAGGCSTERNTPVAKNGKTIQVGGLYATKDKDGLWRVTKALALDEHAVHLRSYANKFSEQPKESDLAKLTLGGLNDPVGFGIGHFPLAKEGFFHDNPVLIKVVPVKEDELDGYLSHKSHSSRLMKSWLWLIGRMARLKK